MYLLVKFEGHRSYENDDINSYINAYMNISEKAELIASIYHNERFSESGMPTYIFEVPEKMSRRIQAIAKRYALQATA